MISVKLNGVPLNEASLEGAVIGMVVEHLRETLGSIRHPETGEFPTIAITGTALDNLQCQVEGSPELLALVQARIAEQEVDATTPLNMESANAASAGSSPAPTAFLSYAVEDFDLARRVAEALMARGIDTWWAEWCIASGDSIRQRIDEGLGQCTHFIVLLTPESMAKPWVQMEIDAGLLRRLGDGVKFIPLRSGIPVGSLSPLLQTMHSPEVASNAVDVSQLINDIHGITRKPPLGAAPAPLAANLPDTGYSLAATALAKHFVQASQTGQKFDPQYIRDELAAALEMSEEDLCDALHELKGLVTDHLGYLVFPEEYLFARFDSFWMPWDPAVDALLVAARLVSDSTFPDKPAEMAELLGWPARRLNPALAYLCERGLVRDFRALDGTNFLAYRIVKTDATRRFVKSRG